MTRHGQIADEGVTTNFVLDVHPQVAAAGESSTEAERAIPQRDASADRGAVRSREPQVDLPRVFRGVDAVKDGVLTPSQLRGPRVRRVLRGVYCPSWLPDSHQLRCEAAGLVTDGDAQVTGTSMATVLGVPQARPSDPVQLVLPDRSQQERYRGIEFRRVVVDLEPGQRWSTGVLATRCRMGFDLAARVDLPEGVARLDAVARAGLVTRVSLDTWLEGDTTATSEPCAPP